MAAAEEFAPTIGVKPACKALGVPRASLYRDRDRRANPPALPTRRKPDRALSAQERQAVLRELHSERFADKAPAEVYATLLDEGTYLCSIRTMYRILADAAEVRERRNQLRHPEHKKPELLATGPNQVWSWDITKLKGPEKWTYYYLYVILDIFSRYVVGWMLASRESAALATRLIEETCAKQAVERGKLTIHADGGSPMISKSLAFLLSDLGVTKSHSRPHVSNDNPFSESQFKTLKYRPGFPDRFGSPEDAEAFCKQFFPWYNDEHHHTGIGLLTPAMVHYGAAAQVVHRRNAVLAAAYDARPERFVRQAPIAPMAPETVWINPPKEASTPILCQGPEGATAQPARTLDTPVSPTILGASGPQHGSCLPGEGTPSVPDTSNSATQRGVQ